MRGRGFLAGFVAALALVPPAVPGVAAVGDTDLQVGVRAVANRVQIGNYAYFDTGAANNGPNDATGVVITDQLPAGLVFAPALSDPACSASGQTVTCPVGVMWNHSVTDPFRIAVQTTALGTFTVTGSVSADQSDPIPSNNSASAAVTVVGPADISVSLRGPAQVDVRTTNTLTVDIGNRGPDTAGNTTLDVSLAPEMSPAGWSASQGSCQGFANTTPMTLHCDLGSVPAGSTAEVVLSAYAFQEGTGTTTATVASDRPDPNTADNSAGLTTTVNPVADIQVAGGPSVTPNNGQRSTVIFTIVVYNGGPSTANSVALKDSWSGTVHEFELRSISTDRGSCSATSSTGANCAFGTLTPGETATVKVTIEVWGSGTMTDTAVAASNVKDPDSTNNTAVLTATI